MPLVLYADVLMAVAAALLRVGLQTVLHRRERRGNVKENTIHLRSVCIRALSLRLSVFYAKVIEAANVTVPHRQYIYCHKALG